MADHGDVFVSTLNVRIGEILDRCTRCGKCVEVCPTAGPAGIDIREPSAIVGDVLDILRGGGDAESRGARWASTCTGSGRCLSACDDGVNPRFMLAATRLRLNERRAASERHATGQAGFQKMSEAVKVLSRLQLPADLLAGMTRSARADSGPAARCRHVSWLQRPQDAAHRAALPGGLESARHALQSLRRSGQLLRCHSVPRRRHQSFRAHRRQHGGRFRRHRRRAGAHLVPDMQHPTERNRHAEHGGWLRLGACCPLHRRADRSSALAIHSSRQ